MAETINYLGNPLLKKPNVPFDFTEEQIAEYIKCKDDPIYFIKNYMKIVHVDHGLVPFDLWDFQEDMIRTFYEDRFVICKMPRQTGKSTTIIAFLLHYVLYNQDVRVGILANKGATARELLGRLQLAYENLPLWLQQGIVEWNKGSIELENGSKMLASSTSSSAIRGGTFNIIFLDEFAFVPEHIAEEFFRSVYPTISSGKSTKVLIVSTPNGMNQFYKMWIDSVEKRSDYTPIDVHWSQVPGRDDEWKEQTIRNTSEDQFRVEFETEFIGSSNTLISPTKLRQMTFKPPVYEKDGLNIWELPKKDRTYFMTCDVARGAGKDFSAFTVLDITDVPYKLVARYKDNNISTLLYPNVIYKTATDYNSAWVLVEANDIGGQVADTLYYDMEYENLISSTVKGRAGQIVSAGFGKDTLFGIKTTAQVKRIGCQTLKTIIEENQLLILDFDTVAELTSFSVRGKSYAATEGNHDDLVMTLVLFSWMTTQRYFKDLLDQDLRLKLFEERMKQLEDEILPLGFVSDGTEEDIFIDSDGERWTVVGDYDFTNAI
tara:strand:+ start:768 stop:2405 length:1638 start_codon:yes stop_codon:yes gene_type:complete